MSAHVLLLAGTGEARELAERLAVMPGIELTASLSGVTAKPAPLAGRVRRGGFGGREALAKFLVEKAVTAVVDATHPFATRISANAAAACAATSVPRLRLLRLPWAPEPNWRRVATLAEAAAALPPGAVALLTTGRKETAPFAERTDVSFLVRVIEPLEDLPPHIEQIVARPPFSVDSELALMRDRAVTHLVAKNSGGPGRARLDAAMRLDLPVLMVDRPILPPGPTVASPAQAVAWVARTVADGA